MDILSTEFNTVQIKRLILKKLNKIEGREEMFFISILTHNFTQKCVLLLNLQANRQVLSVFKHKKHSSGHTK